MLNDLSLSIYVLIWTNKDKDDIYLAILYGVRRWEFYLIISSSDNIHWSGKPLCAKMAAFLSFFQYFIFFEYSGISKAIESHKKRIYYGQA